MKKHLLLFLLAVFCCIGTVTAGEMKIVFKSGTGSSDASGTITGTTPSSYISEGSDFISTVSGTSQVYLGKSGYGLKIGSKNNVGKFTLNLKNKAKVTKVVINAEKFGSDTGNITLNGKNATAPSDNMTFTLDGNEISALTIATTAKRAYIKSMVITTADATAAQDAQVVWKDEKFDNQTSITIDEGAEVYCYPWSLAASTEPANYTVDSSDENVAMFDETSYTIVGMGPGTATITAKWDAFDNYAAGNASINVTVRATKPIETPDGIKTTVYMNDQAPTYYGVDGTADWLSHDGEFIFSTAGTATGDTYPAIEGNEGELKLRINALHGGQVTISAPEGYLIKGISAINTNDENTSIAFNGNTTASGVFYTFTEATDKVVVTALQGAQNTAYITQFEFVLVKTQTTQPTAPATPVFTPGEGYVKAGTQVTVKAEGATSLMYMIEYDGAAEDEMDEVEGDTYTFTVNYDCTVTVEASNAYGKSNASAIYLIEAAVPEKPTFSVQDGALNYLWPVTMKSEGATSLRYTID